MMLRRLLLTLILNASLAVVALPATAQLHRHHPMARHLVHASNISSRPLSKPKDPDVPWWLPLVEAIPTLLFMFGAIPGIVASSKGLPNWKSYFWRGIFFGFLFFPIVLILLYQVLKYESEPITNQAQIRPPNVAVPQAVPQPVQVDTKPPPISFQPEPNP
jgi:hypothetical protein